MNLNEIKELIADDSQLIDMIAELKDSIVMNFLRLDSLIIAL